MQTRPNPTATSEQLAQQRTDENSFPAMLLIPGAWMGGWIWDPTIERLRRTGVIAHTLTLTGLDPDVPATALAQVRLADHVDDAVRAVESIDHPVVVVGHSYSGLLAGIVADRLPDQVVRIVIVAGFFPRNGRSLLDDWGSSNDERESERADIERAGMVWAPPPAEGIETDDGLDVDQAFWLGQRLTPHPGHTILDAASMQRPITEQRVTVVANVGDGADPRSTLPEDLKQADLDKWDFQTVPAGHWPMLGCPTELDRALLTAASTAAID